MDGEVNEVVTTRLWLEMVSCFEAKASRAWGVIRLLFNSTARWSQEILGVSFCDARLCCSKLFTQQWRTWAVKCETIIGNHSRLIMKGLDDRSERRIRGRGRGKSNVWSDVGSGGSRSLVVYLFRFFFRDRWVSWRVVLNSARLVTILSGILLHGYLKWTIPRKTNKAMQKAVQARLTSFESIELTSLHAGYQLMSFASDRHCDTWERSRNRNLRRAQMHIHWICMEFLSPKHQK